MEGYDTILIGNLYAYPSFQKAYGTYYPDLKESIITGPWQIGLGDAASVGSIIGLIINGYVTERFGHRRVIIAGLVVLSAFIFILCAFNRSFVRRPGIDWHTLGDFRYNGLRVQL